MFVHDRHRAILERLARRPRWAFSQLQREMRVSRSTLRRDLLELEEDGHIVRVHGGVVHRDFLKGEPTFDRRGKENVDAKRAIGVAAAAMIQPNEAVYIDAGTTGVEVARAAMLRPDVKIFTHSLRIGAEAASSDAAASVTLVGGEVRNVSQAVVGGLALQWMQHLSFDTAFIAASGVSAIGLMTTELSEAAMKQAIIARSRRVVLVADSAKWDHAAPVEFSTWNNVHTWVTDAALPRAAKEAITRHRTTVVLAKETK